MMIIIIIITTYIYISRHNDNMYMYICSFRCFLKYRQEINMYTIERERSHKQIWI